MTTFVTGRTAEAAAAEYLKKLGFKIIEQNWKTRWCEIDIVAQKAKTIYFVEVKYRKSAAFGSGLEYITAKKLDQMRFAAEFWVAEYRWQKDYQLAAVEVTGPAYEVGQLVTDLIDF